MMFFCAPAEGGVSGFSDNQAAADGWFDLKQTGLGRIFKFLAEHTYIDPQIIQLIERFRAPDGADNFFVGEDFARVPHQQVKERVFCAAQTHASVAHLHSAFCKIHI